MGKFYCYAVWVGRRPGIYFSWNECLAQVHGYPGAIFKGFYSLEEAELAFNGIEPHTSSPASNLMTGHLMTGHERGINVHRRKRQEGYLMTYIVIGMLLVIIMLLTFIALGLLLNVTLRH